MHRLIKIILFSLGLVSLIFPVPLRLAHAQDPYTQPQINKRFADISIKPGVVTQLTVTIFNENTFGLINAAWTDSMPVAIKIANPANIVNTCGGTVGAVPGTSTFSLVDGSVPAKPSPSTPGECLVTINVTSNVKGNHINNIPVGALTANDADTGLIPLSNEDPASATLKVDEVKAPSLSKSFNGPTVWAGQTSQLEIRITNNEPVGGVTLTQTTLTDYLPTVPDNLVVAPIPNGTLSVTCGGSASLTAVAGSGSVTLNNGSIAPQAICIIHADVVSVTQGIYTNIIPAGPVGTGSIQTLQGVTNATLAQAQLNVQEIGILKDITPASIPAGGVSTVTLTLRNPTGSAYTGVTLTDNLPAGMTVYGTPATPQCGGTITSTANWVKLEAGTIPASATPPTLATCEIKFDVTTPATAPTATLTNTIGVGAMTTDQLISNPAAASDTLAVQAGLTVLKAFSPATITVGGISTVTITLRNHTASAFTNVNLTDLMPAGLTVSGTPVSPQCSGTITSTANSVTLAGGTIPLAPTPPGTPGTCTIVFQVTSPNAGTYSNTIPAQDVTTEQGVRNLTTTTTNPNLTVTAGDVPVTVSKSFNPGTITTGANTSLIINITAPADANLTGFKITDTLPAGVTITNVNSSGVADTPDKNANCVGGTLSAVAGTGVIIWDSGGIGSITAGLTCTIDVWVTSITPGTVTNTITPADIIDDQTRTISGDRTAILTVTSLRMSKVFFPPVINPGGRSRLTITLTNIIPAQLINVNLTDNLATMNGAVADRVNIANPANALTTCNAAGLASPVGVTATPGSQIISLSNGIVIAQAGIIPGTCWISVDVVGTGAATTRTNTIPILNVSADVEGGNPGIRPAAQAQANLTIGNLSMGVVKGFNPVLVYGGAASILSINLTNPNTNTALTGITFTDNMPAGMILAAPPGFTTGACGGILSGNAGEGSFSYSGGSLVANSNCTLTLRVTMVVNGNLTNVLPGWCSYHL